MIFKITKFKLNQIINIEPLGHINSIELEFLFI